MQNNQPFLATRTNDQSSRFSSSFFFFTHSKNRKSKFQKIQFKLNSNRDTNISVTKQPFFLQKECIFQRKSEFISFVFFFSAHKKFNNIELLMKIKCRERTSTSNKKIQQRILYIFSNKNCIKTSINLFFVFVEVLFFEKISKIIFKLLR